MTNGPGRRKVDRDDARTERLDALADRTIRNPTAILILVMLLVMAAILQQFGSDRGGRERARDQIAAIAAQARDTHRSLEILRDCTERPDSACARRQQAQTNVAIQALVQVTVATGLCSVTSATQPEYEACIKDQTSKVGATAPPEGD